MVQLILTNNALPMHLGGHENETHLDEGALDLIIKEFDINSYLDIGCGPGGMVDLAKTRGLEVLGVDGDYTVERPDSVKNSIIIHDYEKGSALEETLDGSPAFDLCWTVEFVEHVHAHFIHNFARDMQKCKYILMTHALPGQPGHHHVNCQPIEYWAAIMVSYGLIPDVDMTNKIRAASTMKERYVREQSLFLRNMRFAA